jgi:hypothetical protein
VTRRHFRAARRHRPIREIGANAGTTAYLGILCASSRQILAPPNPNLRGKFSVMAKKFTKFFEN